MAKKLTCYVDETGQDARSNLFVVAVVVTEENRDRLAVECETIEAESGKGRVKWVRAVPERRLAYIRRVLKTIAPQCALCFTTNERPYEYSRLTVQAIVLALRVSGSGAEKATIFVDGLPRTLERRMGGLLREEGIRVRKVRGVKKDENDALIRLADALCGFVRAASEGQREAQKLLEHSLRTGLIRDVSPK